VESFSSNEDMKKFGKHHTEEFTVLVLSPLGTSPKSSAMVLGLNPRILMQC
jgi:hypothetical protein